MTPVPRGESLLINSDRGRTIHSAVPSPAPASVPDHQAPRTNPGVDGATDGLGARVGDDPAPFGAGPAGHVPPPATASRVGPDPGATDPTSAGPLSIGSLSTSLLPVHPRSGTPLSTDRLSADRCSTGQPDAGDSGAGEACGDGRGARGRTNPDACVR